MSRSRVFLAVCVTTFSLVSSAFAFGEAASVARRILHLQNGQTIRVESKSSDGATWEYRSMRAPWRTLPAGFVVRTELESEALAAYAKERAGAKPANADERVALASVALEHGLVAEAFVELDAALAQAPDHAGARELLARPHLIDVPSAAVEPGASAERREKALAELLRFCANASPAAREIAVRELAQAASGDELRSLLEAELASGITARRSFATLALRRLLPGQSVRPLLVRAVRDVADEVRVGAALALKAANEPGVIAPVVRALESASPRVREQAAQALGNMGYPAAIEPLVARVAALSAAGGSGASVPHANIFVGRQIAYLQDFDVEVATFQAVSDPTINTLLDGQATDVGVAGVNQVTTYGESLVVRRALERLAGERPGDTNRAWLDWWKRREERARAAERARTQDG